MALLLESSEQALDTLELWPGSKVLITAGSGACGGCATELVKLDGLSLVADASEADHPVVAGFGKGLVLPRGDDLAPVDCERFSEHVDRANDGELLNDSQFRC